MVIIMKYYKYHALGNSFILINKEDDILKNQEQIKKILAKDIGIGADGLLIVDQKENKIKFYNNDATEANFCGNGIRAYFAHIYKYFNKNNNFIKTNFGNITYSGKVVKAIDDYNYHVTVKVKNNHPNLKQIKFTHELMDIIGYETKIGVNHFIIFQDENRYFFDKIKTDQNLLKKIQNSKLFTDVPNIDLIEKISDKDFKILTYERGVGFTSSCGSGAIVTSYVDFNLHNYEQKILTYHLFSKYGKVKVKISTNNIILTGPVTLVSKGDYYG